MSKEVCLIVLFNHRFDENIERLEQIYKNRFSNRYYLVPFYDGNKKNVIPIYECSYQFQGYLAQGIDRIFDEKYEHYFVVADDMIINPTINELNYKHFFCLDEQTGYISYWYPLSEWKCGFERIENALIAHSIHKGVNVEKELPSPKAAFDCAYEKGYVNFDFPKKAAFNSGLSYSWKYWTESRSRIHLLVRVLLGITNKLEYPYMCGYSDIFIVSKEAIKDFCRISGIFAAMRLHVETAIPTAMLLSQKKVVVNKDLKYKERLMWDRNERERLAEECNWRVSELLEKWDENLVCIHPIKLSQWKD